MAPPENPEPTLRDAVDAIHGLQVHCDQLPHRFQALHDEMENQAERLLRRLDAFEKVLAQGFEDIKRLAMGPR